jgi:hypothetical protein
MTIAEEALRSDDPYSFGIARFALRTLDRENRKITFKFDDGSEIIFNIRYEVAQ